jgi:hypothetical protein
MEENLAIKVQGPAHPVTGDELRLEASGLGGEGWTYAWQVHDAKGKDARGTFTHESPHKKDVVYQLPEEPGILRVQVTAKRRAERHVEAIFLAIQKRPLTQGDTVPVTIGGDGVSGPISVNLRRAAIVDTPDLPLWSVIRASTDKLSFNNYADWMDGLFCGTPTGCRASSEPSYGTRCRSRTSSPTRR